MTKTASRGPGRPPAAKSAQTRGRILHAAREVFSEVGYDAATFQEIAARADLTRPAINHYFASKHALYAHVVEHTNGVVIAAGLEKAAEKQSFTGRISAFLGAAVSAKEYDRAAAAFMVTSVLESQRHPELTAPDADSLEQTRQFAATAVRDGIANGELRSDLDAESAAETLVAAFWGLGFYAGFVGDQQRLVTITDQFMGLLGNRGWLTGE
ncbi:MAG: TetR/AcrR family transcriptional regulator [Mycobacterium sp.]|nr:TetR/AcrR family transcriptional regulator [Mycobacterium sp.]